MGFELTTLVVIGTDCIGSCKSNHNATTMIPYLICLCQKKIIQKFNYMFVGELLGSVYFNNLWFIRGFLTISFSQMVEMMQILLFDFL